MKTLATASLAVMLVACMVAAGGCGMAAEKAMGLKGCWTFDKIEGDCVKNAVGPNHGRIQGGLKAADGRLGKALLFNGSGYVVIDNAAYLNAPRYTFAAWVKLKNTGDYQYIVWRGGPAFPEPKECRSIDVWVRMDGGLSGILDYQNSAEPRLTIEGNKKVADDQWHLVACVNDGKTVKFFVDGKKDAEASLTGPVAKSDFPMWIGARPGNVAATGIIDHVRFFDRALTDEEVARLK